MATRNDYHLSHLGKTALSLFRNFIFEGMKLQKCFHFVVVVKFHVKVVVTCLQKNNYVTAVAQPEKSLKTTLEE